MREAHALDIVAERFREFAVRERAVSLCRHAAPRPEMDFVNREWRITRAGAASAAHPVAIAPLVIQGTHAGSGRRRRLPAVREGVAAVAHVMIRARAYAVFVERARRDTVEHALPDTRAVVPDPQRMATRIPAIEVADDRNGFRVRRPHREVHGAAVFGLYEMRAEFFVQAVVRSLAEQKDIVVADERRTPAHRRG